MPLVTLISTLFDGKSINLRNCPVSWAKNMHRWQFGQVRFSFRQTHIQITLLKRFQWKSLFDFGHRHKNHQPNGCKCLLLRGHASQKKRQEGTECRVYFYWIDRNGHYVSKMNKPNKTVFIDEMPERERGRKRRRKKQRVINTYYRHPNGVGVSVQRR